MGTKQNRRRSIWKKAKGRCAHCGRYVTGESRTIDHYIPKAIGGTLDQRNLMPLCKECNQQRKSRIINPMKYYSYAEEWAIDLLLEYQEEYMELTSQMEE